MVKEKEEEDFKQDKIIIFNEIMDVMKSIMLLFNKKKNENDRKQIIIDRNRKADIEENQEEGSAESYLMEKQLIIEAWSKYRPNS